VTPLVIGGTLAGALSLASFHKHKTWDSVLISRFQQIGSVFANALARKYSDDKLQAAYLKISELRERLEHENVYLREAIKLEHNHNDVVGQSDAMRGVLKKAEQVASTDSAVLIFGETGTGKELIARTIHQLSMRKDRPMVKVNCAAMPATLIESELFGREKGAYTGALSREIGRFELADRSTIFLDEIGEMPIELQAKLLRVLQDGEFERLGSCKTLHVDVRVIAATNRDLQASVKDGRFREDLYYRLSVFPIEIPPLRERREDIPALVWHILKNLCKRMGRDVESIQPATLKAFQEYSWPGNIRELGNVIERHLILNPGPVFRAEVPESGEASTPAGQNLDEVERHHMQQVLQNTRWRIRGKGGAAEILGLKPTTLEARMKKLGIARPQ
jgi:formate hydrogenlyase transcriptional activator